MGLAPSQQRVQGPSKASCGSRGRAGGPAGTLDAKWRPSECLQKQAGISTKNHLGTEAEIGALTPSH